MANPIVLELPFPVSANQYWRRGRNGITYVSSKAKQYCEGVAKTCAYLGIKPLEGKIKLTVQAYMPSTNRDLGNTAKVLEDALEGYAYHDDLQIVEQHYYRHEAAAPKNLNAKVIVTVEQIT